MIFSYFDDSSDDRRDRFVATGGVVGTEELVAIFEGMWIAETKHLKSPFRSTDCECRKGQFINSTKLDCDALISNLVDLLSHKGNLVGKVASVVPVPLYREVFPDCSVDDPVCLSVAHLIFEMGREGKRQNLPVKLWFEDSKRDRRLITRVYRQIKSLSSWNGVEREMLSGISFGDKTLAPLQAADLVAREAFKACDNLGIRNYRIPLKRMWETSAFVLWGRDGLEILKANGWPSKIDAILALPASVDFRQRRRDQTILFASK